MSDKNPYVCGKCGCDRLYREDDAINGAAFIACQICGNRWPGGPEPKVASGQLLRGQISNLSPNCPIPKEEIKMVPKKDEKGRILKTCLNCHELKVHHGRGLCAKCYGKKVAHSPSAKKPCTNCLRVMPLQAGGLCAGCRAVARAAPPEGREAALAAAKLRFSAPDYQRYPGRRPDAGQTDQFVVDNKSNGPSAVLAVPAVGAAIPAPAGIQEPLPPAGQVSQVVSMWPANDVVSLYFGAAADRPLLEALTALAKRQRRDPAQQAMWIIQEALGYLFTSAEN